MTHAEIEPMSRPLLALSLYAFAAIAIAGPPVTPDDATGKPAKPAATTAAATDPDTATTAAPSATPSRTGSASRHAKRWHSMLPGMIR